MTNKEEADISNEPGAAAITALHLVGEVIDEANLIVNAAHESGQPWRYVSMLRSLRNGSLGESDYVDMSYLISKGDCDSIIKNNSELVATSTPQRITAELKRNKSEANLVGQGDAHSDTQQNELTKSTSMFINNLFDMSEVEGTLNDPEVNATNIPQDDNSEKLENKKRDENEVINKAMTSLMKSLVFTAISAAFSQHNEMIKNDSDTEPNSPNDSIVVVAGGPKIANEISFLINDCMINNEEFARPIYTCLGRHGGDVTIDVKEEANKENHENYFDCKNEVCVESIITFDPQETFTVNAAKEHTDVEETNAHLDLDENLYLTLNRDYEQPSEEVEQTTHDPNDIQLHEIELLTAKTSEINLSHPEEPQKEPSDLVSTSTVSASASGVSKTSLVNRCRHQGTRLLTCIRGWWRRNTPSEKVVQNDHIRSKVCKSSRNTMPGIWPLSPDARRRAPSLLLHNKHSVFTPRRRYRDAMMFSTINENLKSSRWNNSYTFELDFDQSGV